MKKRHHLYKLAASILAVVVLIVIVFAYTTFRADRLPEGAIVYIVPVYGQSLALGEETQLITDTHAYGSQTRHRVKSEFLNERIGYFADDINKQRMKILLRHENRHLESSVFGLGECFVNLNPNKKIYLCTFPAGRGGTKISLLGKGTKPYDKFIAEIKMTYEKASAQGATVIMPAFCWMQGENDLTENTTYNYAAHLKKFRSDVERDVKAITHQRQSVYCILYQTNSLSLTMDKMNPNRYECRQVTVPEQQRQLIMSDKYFCASGPVYPYNTARNYVHIDAYGQKQMGWLEGLTLHRLQQGNRFIGLQPQNTFRHGDTLIVQMHVPVMPLVIDTITVAKAKYYGFSVVNKANQDVLQEVKIANSRVYLICKGKTTHRVKIRYGVNGDYMKGGRMYGSRGNLRDSQGRIRSCPINGQKFPLHNWCYIFEKEVLDAHAK